MVCFWLKLVRKCAMNFGIEKGKIWLVLAKEGRI
jgi:hypothetical protein